MTLHLPTLLRHALGSLSAPRDEARWVMSAGLPRAARWQALLLIVVISVILAQISMFVAPLQGDVIMAPLMMNPVMAAIVQMSLLVLMVFAIYWIGRALGGLGGFGNTILVVAWIQFVMACLQVVQTASMVLIPPLAGLISVAGFVLFFWLLTNFIAELHGFQSLGRVFVMIILAMFGFAFGLSLILTLIGISAMPGAI